MVQRKVQPGAVFGSDVGQPLPLLLQLRQRLEPAPPTSARAATAAAAARPPAPPPRGGTLVLALRAVLVLELA